jgi:hypothetical protein
MEMPTHVPFGKGLVDVFFSKEALFPRKEVLQIMFELGIYFHYTK